VNSEADALDAAYQRNNRNANISETNPYGSSEFSFDDQGNVTGRTTTLAPQQQAILDGQQARELQAQGAQAGALDQYGQAAALDFDRAPSANARNTDNFSANNLQEVDVQNDATRQRVESSYFDRSKRMLDKQYGDVSNQETANLRARGYQFGGDDYNKLYNDRVTNPRDQAFANAADQAIQAGGAEAQRQFGMQSGLRGQQFGEQLSDSTQNMNINAANFDQDLTRRNQAIGEQMTARNQPLQEAATLSGMQQGVTNPTFNAFNAQQSSAGNVGGIGMGFAGMANDRTMQEDAQKENRWTVKNTPRGGTPPQTFEEWAQRQLFSNMLGQENMQLQSSLDGGPPRQPRPPSAIGGALTGIGQGIGQGIGGAITGAF
jgi:YD repeat-containing protein